MASPFDLDAIMDSFATSGHWDTQLELDNEMTTVRFHRSTSDPALAQLQAPPGPDPDCKAPVERLRDYLQKALGVTTGPPVLFTQVLAASFGYRGTQIRNTAEGLRVLLQIPSLDTIDLAALFARLTADSPAPPAAVAPSTDTAWTA
jgi:hypothetical protein